MEPDSIQDVSDVIAELKRLKQVNGRNVFRVNGRRVVTVATQLQYWIGTLYILQDVNADIPDNAADVTLAVCTYLGIGAIKYT